MLFQGIPLLFFFIIKKTISQNLTVTVCDCNQEAQVGAITFADQECSAQTQAINRQALEYTVYTTKPPKEQIVGVMCSRWIKTIISSTNILYDNSLVRTHAPIDTSFTECITMETSKACNENAMKYKNGKWEYSQDPVPKKAWMRTYTSKALNCLLEAVTLDLDVTTNEVDTPLGKTNASAGAFSLNHVTITWDELIVFKKKEERHVVASGEGELISEAGSIRIVDHSSQIDFHVGDAVDGAKRTFKVKNSDILTVELGVSALSTKANYPDLYSDAHLQFVDDNLEWQQNRLVSTINSMNCELRKLRHAQATATAQYNGWLAAAQLNLSKCTKLTALGSTVLVKKCRPKNVTFQTEITRCGPQLKYEGYTLNLDGWELVTYLPCYSNLGFVNINGIAHVLKNGNWQPLPLSKVSPAMPLLPEFNFQDLKFREVGQKNPAYSDVSYSHMNVMAEIVAAMSEHNTWSDGEQQPSNAAQHLLSLSNQSSHYSVLDSLYFYLSLAGLAVVVIIVIRISFACGLHILLWKLICKPVRAPTTHQDVAPQPLGHRQGQDSEA